MNKKVFLIGCGPGLPELASPYALNILKNCREVYAPQRLAKSFSAIREDIKTCLPMETKDKVASSAADTVGVLISGDCGFYSLAKSLYGALSPMYETQMIPGLNSMQYLAAKFGLSYDDVLSVSLHGRGGSVLGPVSYNEKVFVLTGGVMKASCVCGELAANGLGETEVFAGENMAAENERFVRGKASKLAKENFADLTSLIVVNKNFVEPYGYIRDEDFIRGGVPMTKSEIRRLCVAEIAPKPADIIFDIGAGTGSVAVELARKTPLGIVYAIEKEPEGIDLIEQNRRKHGSYNLIVVPGEAPAVLENLPSADKAFIGGSGGNMGNVFKVLTDKNPKVKIAVTAITLESLNEASSLMKKHGFQYDIICINAAKAKKAGAYNMMIARNPVYIISGLKIGA